MKPATSDRRSLRRKVILHLTERTHPPLESVTIKGSKVLRPDVGGRIYKRYQKKFGGMEVGIEQEAYLNQLLHEEYAKAGFSCGAAQRIDGLDRGEANFPVNEPRMSRLSVRFVDESGNDAPGQPVVGERAVLDTISLRVGDLYSAQDGRKALQEAFSLQARACFACRGCLRR